MRAAVLERTGSIAVKQVRVPALLSQEVLLRVAYCGICGTDLHAFEGTFPVGKMPIILGHEFAGVIAELGKDVKGLKVGDRVTADINIGCDRCYHCLRGERLLCAQMEQIGLSRDGGFAEFVKVPVANIRALPDTVSLLHAAFVEPLSCAIHGQDEAGVELGQSVAIIGAGPMGLIHVQLSRLRGGAPIVVLEKNPKRRVKAEVAGADVVIDPDTISASESIRHITKDVGADVVIEAVGSVATYELALQLLRRGGKLLFFGAAPPAEKMQIAPYDVFSKEWRIKGVIAASYHFWDQAVTLLEHRRFDPGLILSEVMPLEELQSAMQLLLRDKTVTKIVIKVSDGDIA
jgi:2-desacetyl-2-hydroxyethyl bacteriochlorophyllide A dehydrogenase